MVNPKAIAYDLGIALGSITLWLVPIKEVRALGYATSIVFSARGYYTGLTLIAKERKEDESDAMVYDAGMDFHERLLESTLELKLQQLENRFTEYLIPLAAEKSFLDRKLTQALDLGAERKTLTPETAAIAHTFDTEDDPDGDDTELPLTESEIRKTFPEHSDATNWKAILKALGEGANRPEIIRDVLGVKVDVGGAYLDLLKRKYL